MPATSYGGVDINILPESLVKRVDTVTGGASAAYGTDAVAGVVNFILDTEYTGWQLHAQSGATSRSDHDNSEFAATYGVALGERAHLLLNAEYYKADGVFGYEDRDWYQSWGTITNPVSTEPANADPPERRLGRFHLRRPHQRRRAGDLRAVLAGSSMPDGSLAPFVLGEGTLSGGGTSHSITNGGSGDYIGADMQTIAPDAKRGNGFLYLDFDATPNLNLYVQGLAGQSMTDQPDHGGRFAADCRASAPHDDLPRERLPAGGRAPDHGQRESDLVPDERHRRPRGPRAARAA